MEIYDFFFNKTIFDKIMNNIVNLPSEIKFIENKNIYIENTYYYPDGNFQTFLKTYKMKGKAE